MRRFRHIRTRLSVLYAGMFAITLLLVAGVAQYMLLANVERTVTAEMETSSKVFARLLALRSKAMHDSADVLAHDFGFRAAVATGDVPTIQSALSNLRERVGVSDAYVVAADGNVIGDGAEPMRKVAAEIPFVMADGRNNAVIAVGSQAWHFVLTPIMAPDRVGWVMFAVALDAKEMTALERLSAIPLDASMLQRDPGGRWFDSADATEADRIATNDFVAAALTDGGGARPLALASGKAMALAKPLPAPTGEPQAVLLIKYPFAKAMMPYRPLQIGILLIGLLGLLAMVYGSLRLAKSIARPIAQLDAAARRLERGERTEVAVEGDDEIARLARSFNAMSRGILDRENRIAHLAFHDALTGLPNRVLFREQLEAGLNRVRHRDESLAVLCLDLDGFKSINDTLGHPIGDEMLRHTARILDSLAEGAMVARLGGDEFALIVADQDDPDRPRALSQAIVDRMREPMIVAGHRVVSGASIGIAMGPADGGDADTLLKNADLALYRAKQDGRGGFRFFEPALDAAAQARRQIELDLREALAEGHLHLDFQPVLCLKDDRISGFEALLRWRHPTRGLISPVEFIPIAEDTGMIIQIGEWVIHEACRQAAKWPPHLRIAVNVSPLQFRTLGLKGIIVQALARSGLDPSRLEIELTESIFLENSQDILALLHSLRAIGVRFALDDFGTGYSSLSYLRSFPFDKLKIDRSFVTGIATEPSAAAIVHAIVDLATALGMETTAEGVEHEQQLIELRAQGCGTIQGFLFSRPIAADEIGALLEANQRTVGRRDQIRRTTSCCQRRGGSIDFAQREWRRSASAKRGRTSRCVPVLRRSVPPHHTTP